MNSNTVWTYSMYKKVLDEYPFKGKALAKEMNVSQSALEERAFKLGVKSECKFSEEETLLLTQHGRKLKSAAMFLMPNHTEAEVLAGLCELHYC